jgi:hypothetical protein
VFDFAKQALALVNRRGGAPDLIEFGPTDGESPNLIVSKVEMGLDKTPPLIRLMGLYDKQGNDVTYSLDDTVIVREGYQNLHLVQPMQFGESGMRSFEWVTISRGTPERITVNSTLSEPHPSVPSDAILFAGVEAHRRVHSAQK